MRRLPIVGLMSVIVGLVLTVLGPPAAALFAGDPAGDTTPDAVVAPEQTRDDAGDDASSGSDDLLDVVKVDGLLDPIMVDFVERSIDDAAAAGSVGLVLQINSPGAVVSDARLGELVERLRTSSVPVSVWIGPSGGATGAAAVLAGYAETFGMAPGTSWGLGGIEVDAALLEGTVRDVPVRTVSAVEANELGLTTVEAPIIGELIVTLPEVETREVDIEGITALEPVTTVRFGSLPLIGQLLHTVASPAVAYLLITVGMALLIFELFTAGVGVAGMVGVVSLLLGAYGLAVLPFRGWALALLILSMVAFAVDVQTAIPRFWTGAGMVLFVIGSLTLYDGVSMSWITLLVAFAGVALTFWSGMPSMVRTRFATPTIGRDWMIGEMGRAVTDVSPDGVVQIRDAQWRATTNRATPIDQLDAVRVVGIDGLVLEVEPEEGGARDYRERGPKHAEGIDSADD